MPTAYEMEARVRGMIEAKTGAQRMTRDYDRGERIPAGGTRYQLRTVAAPAEKQDSGAQLLVLLCRVEIHHRLAQDDRETDYTGLTMLGNQQALCTTDNWRAIDGVRDIISKPDLNVASSTRVGDVLTYVVDAAVTFRADSAPAAPSVIVEPPGPPPPTDPYLHTYPAITDAPVGLVTLDVTMGRTIRENGGSPEVEYSTAESVNLTSRARVQLVNIGGPMQIGVSTTAFGSNEHEIKAGQAAWKYARDNAISWLWLPAMRADLVSKNASPSTGIDPAWNPAWIATHSLADGAATRAAWEALGWSFVFGDESSDGAFLTNLRDIAASIGREPYWYMRTPLSSELTPANGGTGTQNIATITAIVLDMRIDACRDYSVARMTRWVKSIGADAVVQSVKSLWYSPGGEPAAGSTLGGPLGASFYTDAYEFGDMIRDVTAKLAAQGIATITNEAPAFDSTKWKIFGGVYPAGLLGEANYLDWP